MRAARVERWGLEGFKMASLQELLTTGGRLNEIFRAIQIISMILGWQMFHGEIHGPLGGAR